MPDTQSKLGYNRPEWNPMWEAACEADIPLSFHVGFGTNPVQTRNPGGAIANYTTVASAVIKTVAQLCGSGTLAAFPELHVVCTESNAGWLAWTMHQMDEAHVKHGHWAKPRLEMPPSEYARRQVQVTFQEDPIGVANRYYTGLRCLIWGSDYPHWEGTWPRSREAVENSTRSSSLQLEVVRGRVTANTSVSVKPACLPIRVCWPNSYSAWQFHPVRRMISSRWRRGVDAPLRTAS